MGHNRESPGHSRCLNTAQAPTIPIAPIALTSDSTNNTNSIDSTNNTNSNDSTSNTDSNVNSAEQLLQTCAQPGAKDDQQALNHVGQNIYAVSIVSVHL